MRDGDPVVVRHLPDTCNTQGSAGQNWNGTHLSVNGGAMDGFARISEDAMVYWDGTDLPYYYGLANAFVLCDRWFASAPAQTHPNRRYLQAATSVGLVQTSVEKVLATPDAPNGTILNAGGGCFSVSEIPETRGAFLGLEAGPEDVRARWQEITEGGYVDVLPNGPAQFTKFLGMAEPAPQAL